MAHVKDFQTSRIRTSRIVASGSRKGTPSLLIYSASKASDFLGATGSAPDMLKNVGSDVLVFFSGSASDPTGSVDVRTRSSVTLFGGDIVVSGTMFAERTVIQVDLNQTGSLTVSGALYIANNTNNAKISLEEIGPTHDLILANNALNGDLLFRVNTAGTLNTLGVLSASNSSVVWGYENTVFDYTPADSEYSTIAGGRLNVINDSAAATIGGGYSHAISASNYGVIAGGNNHDLITAHHAAILGGYAHDLTDSSHAVIVGGGWNDIVYGANYSFIGGGWINKIQGSGLYNIIVGGSSNVITSSQTWESRYSVIVGGYHSDILDSQYSLIGGGSKLEASSSDYAAVIGGASNKIRGSGNSFLGGGGSNLITGSGYSFIGGGQGNVAAALTNVFSTIGGGQYNKILASGSATGRSVIAGGASNTILGDVDYGFIGGGYGNVITSSLANSANYSAVLGSTGSTVTGQGSFAIGTALEVPTANTIVLGGGDGHAYDVVVSGSLVLAAASSMLISASMVDIGWDPGTPATAGGPTLRLSAHDSSIADGEKLGTLEFWGGDTTSAGVGAKIIGESAGIWSGATVYPTELQFWTTPAAGTLYQRLVIDKDGKVGIGESAPEADLHVDSDGSTTIGITRTDASINSGNTLGQIDFGGDDGAGYVFTAIIKATAAQTWDSVEGENGTELEFETSPIDEYVTVTRMIIGSEGKVSICAHTGAQSPTSGELTIGRGVNDQTILIDADGSASGSVAFRQDSGFTQAALVLDASDDFVLVNSSSNKDVVFKVNDGGSMKAVGILSGGLSAIAWGYNHTLDGVGSVIGGGELNVIGTETRATIAGGLSNKITSSAPTAGVMGNSDYATIGGGHANEIYNSYFGTIAGGYSNDILSASQYPFIGGGSNNTIRGGCTYGTIAAGYENELGVGAKYSVVLGATGSTVSGQGSFAIGTGLTVPVANTIAIGGGPGHAYEIFLSGTSFAQSLSSSYIETGELRTPTGDLLVDAAGDIVLDADGGNIAFKDNGITVVEILDGGSLQALEGLQVTGSTGQRMLQATKASAPIVLGNLVGDGTAGPMFIIHPDDATHNCDIVLAPAQQSNQGKLFLGMGAQTANNYVAMMSGDGIYGSHNRGATAQVLVMSGGAPADPNMAAATDIGFFVSGSVGSVGTSVAGASVFGGDMVVSGVMYAPTGLSGSYIETGELRSPTGNLFLTGADIYLTAGERDIYFRGGDGTIGLRLQMSGDTGDMDAVFKQQGGVEVFRIDSSQNSLKMATSRKIHFGSANEYIYGNGTDLTVASNNNLNLAATTQVLILSGGAAASPDPAAGTDTNFFVSGTIGSKNSAVKGTALFGGDLHVSGNLTVNGSSPGGSGGSSLGWFSGSAGGTAGMGEGTLTEPWISSSGSLALSGANLDVGQYIRHVGDTTTSIRFDDGRIRLYTEDGTGAAKQMMQLDGTPSVAGTPNIMFNGDARDWDFAVIGRETGKISILVSGTYGSSQYPNAGVNDTNLFLSGTQVLILSGGAGASPDPAAGTDVNFFVSGAIGSRNSAVKGTAIFGGDTVVSGTLTVGGTDFLARGAHGGTISGSIHHTSGGISYIAAGANVTVTSASNGQITIASTATGGGGGGDAVGWFSGSSAVHGDLGAQPNWISTSGSLAVSGSALDVSAYVRHVGDTTTSIYFTDDRIALQADDGTGSEYALIALDGTPAAGVPNIMVNGSGRDFDFGVIGRSSEANILLSGTYGSAQYPNAGSNDTNLFLSGTQVLILSGGAAASADVASFTDTNFFVSGTIGSKDSAVAGTSLFGGDLVVSGTLVANRSDDGAYPAIKIDKDYTGTTTVGNYTTDASGLLIDYDVTGIVGTGQTAIHDALAINYNQDSPTMVGTIEATGADIRMTGGTSGTQTMKGLAITLAGADTNTGIDITAPNDSTHFIARSSDSLLDNFQISVGAAGTTTLSTSDADAAAADLTLDVDGDIVLDADGGQVTIKDDGANHFLFDCDNTSFTIYDDADDGDLFKIQVAANGATTISTTDDGAAAADLTVDIDGDIIFDADGGNWSFDDGGSRQLDITGSSGDVTISVPTEDKDLTFKVRSGSNTTTALNIDGSTAGVKIGASIGSDAANVALEVNYGDVATIGNFDSDNSGGGEVVTFGSFSGDGWFKGSLRYLDTDGQWIATSGSAPGRGASQMLGIALGSSGPSEGMLIKGFFKTKDGPGSGFAPGYLSGSFAVGKPVYVASGGAEYIQSAAPGHSGNFVRIIGYGTPATNIIYFDPDKTWVENS